MRDKKTGRFLKKRNRIEKYGAYAIIFTEKNEPIFCDNEDIKTLLKYSWSVQKVRLCRHAITNKKINGKYRITSMHRLLMNPPSGYEIDHKDNNGCNNRRDNLRITKHSFNTKNASKRTDNTSGYKGVHLVNKKRWQARIQVDGKRLPLGCYSTKKEAAKAYNEAAIKFYGEFAHINKF